MPTKRTTIRTSHACISVRDSGGSGLPIVMLHGPGSTKCAFASQFNSSLDREFRLVAIDLPGHGASSNAFAPRNTYSVSGYADAVIEVMEFLGIDDAVVVGSSLCGQIALEMMASFPGIVGVMLAGSAPLFLQDDGLVGGLCAEVGMALAAAAHRRTDGRALAMLLDDLRAGNFTDGRVLIETAAAPVAIVNGASDPIVDADCVAALDQAHLWEQTCRLLPNVGGMPFADVPDMFNQMLRRFARDTARRASESDRTWGLSLSA